MRAETRVAAAAVAGAAALRLAHDDGTRLQVQEHDALDDAETWSFFGSNVEVIVFVAVVGLDRDDLQLVASKSGKDHRYPEL